MPRLYLRYLFPVALLSLLVVLLDLHWQIVTAIIPLEFYEGSVPLMTGIFADGDNPYTRAFQPQAAYVYPPLYNIVVAFLTHWFDNTLLLHRAVSGVFILATIILIGTAAARASASRRHGIAAAIMLYAALLYYGTPVAGTNAAGVLLFIICTVVPWLDRFSTRSLLIGLLGGVLSFYTKQYFVLGIAILCLYVFLYVSMAKALLLGLGFITLLGTSLVVVHHTSPYYLDNTLFAPAAAINALQSWSALGIQLQLFIQVYAGLLGIMIVAGLIALGRRRSSEYPVHRIRLWNRGWQGPLLTPPLDYFWFCLFWSTTVIVVWLGKNPGNYMTYLFQLMSPFFLIVAMRTFAQLQGKLSLLHPVILISLYQVFSILPQESSVEMKNWNRMERMIANSDLVLASPILVYTLLQQGKPVYQNGHTFYFPLATHKPDFFIKEKKENRVGYIWNEYLTDLYEKVRRQEFDLILVSKLELSGIFISNPPPQSRQKGTELLRQYYRHMGKIVLSLTDRRGGKEHTIHIYRPRTRPLGPASPN